jgi:hypothetical protein
MIQVVLLNHYSHAWLPAWFLVQFPNRNGQSFMLIMSIRKFKSTSSADLTEKFNFFLRRTYQTYYFFLDLVYVYGVLCHFQQYFSYTVGVVLLIKETNFQTEMVKTFCI